MMTTATRVRVRAINRIGTCKRLNAKITELMRRSYEAEAKAIIADLTDSYWPEEAYP